MAPGIMTGEDFGGFTMARNGSGFFNKFLNVIGLVDEPQDEGYGDRYANGRQPQMQNSRPSTYVPRQQNSRTADTRRRTVIQDERPASSRYGANTPARNRYNDDFNEGYTVRRTAAAELEDEFDTPRTSERRSAEPARRAAAPSSEPVRRESAPVPRNQNAPMSRANGAARTVMYNLKSLEECSEVVDSLIANNIVVLMLDQLDDRMTQRAVDTLSGAAFALHATIRKASDRTYLIAPRTVEVNDPGYYGRRG